MNKQKTEQHEAKQSDIKKRVDSSSEEDLNDDNETDEEDEELEDMKVKGLFSDRIFKNVNEMFKHESEENNFNLINCVNRYNMNMIDYIKMINFIRSQVKHINL